VTEFYNSKFWIGHGRFRNWRGEK